MKTESEINFEKFCERHSLSLAQVPVSTTKTPDYTLTIAGRPLVVEVKEVMPTAEELEGERLAKERGVGIATNATIGKAVRNKIDRCSKQIKARTDKKHPGLLVLWEQGLCHGRHTEAHHIRAAMEGFDQVLVNVPPMVSGLKPSYAGMKHGGRRKMTKDDNTSISAVALLCVPSARHMWLRVFHNRFAKIPLDPQLLSNAEITHFRLEDDPGKTTRWKLVSGPEDPTSAA